MKSKLFRFFTEDLAPEIVDANLGYRGPEYRAKAIRSYLKDQEEEETTENTITKKKGHRNRNNRTEKAN
jgi:hypothetical protein